MGSTVENLLQADFEKDLPLIKEIFEEYASSLGFDLHFQEFKRELAELPGEYSPPKGRLLLAVRDDRIAGCVALRKLGEGSCEMKRGKGIGRKLAEAIIDEARKIGYTQMRLDTVPFMKEALALYLSLGFKEIKPYRFNPIEGTKFMELDLI
jgi:putative acetyltransferase